MNYVSRYFVILASVTGLLLPTESFANSAFAFRLQINAVTGGMHGMPMPMGPVGPVGPRPLPYPAQRPIAPVGPLQNGVYGPQAGQLPYGPGMMGPPGVQAGVRVNVAVAGRRRGCGGGGIRISFAVARGGCGGGMRRGGCFGGRRGC